MLTRSPRVDPCTAELFSAGGSVRACQISAERPASRVFAWHGFHVGV